MTQTTQRMYDVFRVTRGGVIGMARNVNHEEAVTTMAITLAAYDASWQIQPENPRGMVKVLDTNSGDYHMVILLETEASRNRYEEARLSRLAEQKSTWLVQFHSQNGLDLPRVNTDDMNTPVDGYTVTDELSDGIDVVEAANHG